MTAVPKAFPKAVPKAALKPLSKRSQSREIGTLPSYLNLLASGCVLGLYVEAVCLLTQQGDPAFFELGVAGTLFRCFPMFFF